MEDAELKLIRAVRREVKRAASRARGDLPWTAPSSVSSGASGDDGELTPEFIAAAEAVNRALARAVAEEVEDQLTDVLMCLGEETTKVEVLSYALARGFGVEVPQLLREAGYSPDASPPGSRDESPTGEPHPNAISAVPRDGRRPAASRYANLLPPSARRDEGSRGLETAPAGPTPVAGLAALRSVVGGDADPRTSGTSGTPGTSGMGADFSTPAGLPSAGLPSAGLPSAGLPSAGLPGLSPVKLEAALSATTYDSASEKADFVSAASAASAASRQERGPSRRPYDVVESPSLRPVRVGSARRRLLDDDGDDACGSRDGDPLLPVARFLSHPASPVEVAAAETRGDDVDSRRDVFARHDKTGGRPTPTSDATSDDWDTSSSERDEEASYSEVFEKGSELEDDGRVGAPPNVVEGYYSPAGAGVFVGSETTFTESGEPGTVADDDGESRSVIYAARSPATPRLGDSPAKAAAAPGEAAATTRATTRARGHPGFAGSFRRVAALAGAVAGLGGGPGLMTMPVRQKDWMVIHESTF